MIRRAKVLACLLGTLLGVGGLNALAKSDRSLPRTVEVLSGPNTIDRLYKSMEGVTGDKRFEWPVQQGPPELLWVTGGRIAMMRSEDKADGTERFLCHAYLKFDRLYFKSHQNESPAKLLNPQGRLFTFVQGQPEIRLPEGFGIPVLSTEPFDMEYMVINPTQPPQPFQVDTVAQFRGHTT
jgi:hypothetical protein